MPLAFIMSTPALAPTSNGARLVTTDGRELPLTGTSVSADAAGGIARTVLEQRFQNPHAETLSVTYSLPLPADGAVSGFAFSIGGRRIAGEVQRRTDARAHYERALIEGRSAALLEQDRSSLFTQEIGNIPPGETIVAEITIDQPLRWLDEGAWEWRFPTVVSPRYLGEPGRVPDAARVMQSVTLEPIAARFTLACTVRDTLPQGRVPESPSHAMTRTEEEARPASDGSAPAVTMRIDEGARLDRDIVVRWPVAAPAVGLHLHVGRPPAHRPHAAHAYGLLTIVPPLPAARRGSVSRDLIVLLDTSGSMGGSPLDQARRVVGALVATLGPNDQLEMIEFSNKARRWRNGAVAASKDAKRDALQWLDKLKASSSTEMREGIREALRTVRPDAQRQVILVTDGQIGFETEVIAEISARLPASSRLHTVGVGSAINRSLTGPAARAGHGIEVIIGLGEDPGRAAARLVARTSEPLVVDLRITGSALVEHAPRKLPDLFAGAPALVALSLRREGGDLTVRGRTADGVWEQQIGIPPAMAPSGSEAVVALFGREAIEDRELHLAAGGPRRDLDAEIERLGLDFQLATRLTSWIAVTRDITIDPAAARRHERMPHELPSGVSAEGLGLRPAGPLDEGLSAAPEAAISLAAPMSEASLARPVAARPSAAMPSTARPVAAPSSLSGYAAPEKSSAPHAAPSLPKSRRTGLVPFASFLVLIAFAFAYVLLQSIALAAAIAFGVLIVLLVLARLFR